MKTLFTQAMRSKTSVAERCRLGVVLASVAGALLAPPLAFAQAPAPATIEYYHVDALGSVRAVTDATGQVVRRYDYHPFGEGVSVETATDPMRFTGKPRDAETGLDYFGARHYAQRTGRFTTVDPLMNVQAALTEPQRWNRYTYALNSPLTFVDPDGRDPRALWTRIVQSAPAQRLITHPAVQRFIDSGPASTATRALHGVNNRLYDISLRLFAGRDAAAVGRAREALVADLTGGRVANDLKVLVPNLGRVSIDVIGRNGDFITVGGPAKATHLPELGQHLQRLSIAAEQAGVTAQAYYAKGTPDSVIRLAEKWLGKENVFVF